MAQKRITELIDDLDGSPAVATVRLSYQGTDYEIDLSRKHAGELHQLLVPYMAAARILNRSGGRTRSHVSSTSGIDRRAVRAWAQENGHRVSPRGRLSRELIAAYVEAKHG